MSPVVRQDKMDRVLIGIWCLVSFTVSGFFIYHGIFLFSHEGLNAAQAFNASVGILYGLYSGEVLVLALVKSNKVHEKLAWYGVIIMLFTQLVFSLINGGVSIIGILLGSVIVSFMLAANWLAVKYVVKRNLYA